MNQREYTFSTLILPPGKGRSFLNEEAIGILMLAEGAATVTGVDPCVLSINEYYILLPGEQAEIINHGEQPLILWALFCGKALLEKQQAEGEDIWGSFAALPVRYMSAKNRNNMIIRELLGNVAGQKEQQILRETYAELHVGIILVVVARTCCKQPEGVRRIAQPPLTLNDVYGYVRHHLAEDLSLDTLAKRLHFDKYYLAHAFREKAGISLHQYVLHRRLEYANSLLCSGVSVRDTAARSGFSDYGNFIRRYKERWGITPGQFAKQHPVERGDGEEAVGPFQA